MKILSPRVMATVLCVCLLQGCTFIPKLDKVLPDRRKDYEKSEALPNLELPPDLTSEAFNDDMSIPNERATTLSRYKNAPVAGRAETGITEDEEQWLAVPGRAEDIWPALRDYFTAKGYPLELDDAELGVLVTGWSAPAENPTGNDGFIYRNRYKIFSEPGADQISTVLFISKQMQQRIDQSGAEGWLDVEQDREAEKQLVAELDNHLSGNSRQGADTGGGIPAQQAQPQMLEIGDGKLYLSIPDEFTRAFRKTGLLMQQAGVKITGQDKTTGSYKISYFDDTQGKTGFFSRLKFWQDDAPQPIIYQLNLTGVGNKTELIIMDENGDWDSSENARRILSLIQERYNAG